MKKRIWWLFLAVLVLATMVVASAAMAEECEHFAYCTDPTHCYKCGAPYSSNNIRHMNGTTQHDETNHWNVCNDCGEIVYRPESHYRYCGDDPTTPCRFCDEPFSDGRIRHIRGHTVQHDETAHWDVCNNCGDISWGPEPHLGTCTDPTHCYYCGAPCSGNEVEHSWDRTTLHDETSCWNVCNACGEIVWGPDPHRGSCIDPTHCLFCGVPYSGDDIVHSIDIARDETTHWWFCIDCGITDWPEPHVGSCTDPTHCFYCDAMCSSNEVQHSWDRTIQHDETSCWAVCNDCGEIALGPNPHEGSCIDHTHCYFCGTPYSGNSFVHKGTKLRHDETNHWHACLDCGECLWGPYAHYTKEGGPAGICSHCGIPYNAFSLTSLTTDVSSAKVGQQITVTANMSGAEQVLEMEYHVYNQLGQHISGWNGISGVYYYTATEPGAYTFRVYVRTAAGWVNVDSKPVTVTAGTRKAVALKANSTTAKVGDVLTFTTQFEGDGEIAWIEYHIYDTYGNHLTGYRGEGAGISGVYNYPTATTGAGKYTARVYLMAKDGTFTQVDSAQVTVTVGTRKAVALNPNSTTAKVGDTLVFTTQFEGDGPIAWIEYHIYDTYGNHLTGYRGEGSGISGVYNYPTATTGAGKYTARVYLMAADGTFTQVDSVQVTVK